MFIDRAKTINIPTFYAKPAYLRVYNNSRLRYSSRINFDVACNMDFHRFPNDEQKCKILFESFGHTADIVRFNWQKNGSHIGPAILMQDYLMKAEFEEDYKTTSYDLAYPGDTSHNEN